MISPMDPLGPSPNTVIGNVNLQCDEKNCSWEGDMKRLGLVLSVMMFSSGCIVAGGYSSGRGWFIWPGTIVILVVVVLFSLLRSRG